MAYGALDDAPGERGQPGTRVVAAARRELREHLVGPVLRPGFPAVADQVLQAPPTHQRPDRVLVHVEIRRHVRLDVRRH